MRGKIVLFQVKQVVLFYLTHFPSLVFHLSKKSSGHKWCGLTLTKIKTNKRCFPRLVTRMFDPGNGHGIKCVHSPSSPHSIKAGRLNPGVKCFWAGSQPLQPLLLCMGNTSARP